MTYIYDILLNFNDDYYEFYDWNRDDKLVHIKKIPIYKVSNNDMKNIVFSTVIFDNNFLEMIKDKTEVFLKHEVKKMKYSCLICSGEKILAINLNDNGKIISRSDLLIDEYNEILSVIDECKYTEVNYIIENRNEINEFKTRKDKEKSQYIIKELNKFNEDELKYLHYEIFLENEDSKTVTIRKLSELNNQEQLYKLVKMIANKYKKIK